MKTNDQWFRPGDKVMRVAQSYSPIKNPAGTPKKGEVLCVSEFYEGPCFNAVMFVGYGTFLPGPNGTKIGYRATNFRKVEEIKLCVAALEKEPVKKLQEKGAARE